MIHSTIACNLDTNLLQTALPLFAREKVQALEWSFDALFKFKEIPPWFLELLDAFSREGRLIGHGVYFSLFSGRWLPEQQDWLERLRELSARFTFDHLTEHFGFMTGADFHRGAPVPIPFTEATLAIGVDRLQRIQDAADCPVGLENLAFAYALDEVKIHGEFLEKLVSPVNGFIILDLHNLFCQAHNFGIDFQEIIHWYPLERVREIHISGGSWEDSVVLPGQSIRRDTHDDSVPAEVFEYLENTIPLCPNLKFVVMEQLGTALNTPQEQAQFRRNFWTMDEIVQKTPNLPDLVQNTFLPEKKEALGPPVEAPKLYAQQIELSGILENAKDYQEAQQLLQASSLASSDWHIEHWEPAMLETVIHIARKWK